MVNVITNEYELDIAQAEVGRLLEISERTRDDDNRLGVLAVLIRYYEAQHWALECPTLFLRFSPEWMILDCIKRTCWKNLATRRRLPTL